MDRSTQDDQRRLLAALVRRIREERGILQVEFADRLGEPQSFVSKLESAERRIEFIRLEEICTALELSVEEFLERWRAIRSQLG